MVEDYRGRMERQEKTLHYIPPGAPPRCRFDGEGDWRAVVGPHYANGWPTVSFSHRHPGGEFGGAGGCGSGNMTQRFDTPEEAEAYFNSL